MLLRVSRRFSNGFMIDVNYTWSKNIDNTDTVEDNQGFNAGAGARGANHYLYDLDNEPPARLQRRPAPLCRHVPLRTAVRQGQALRQRERRWSARIVGGWQLGGAVIWQTGFPIAITGASDGAALTRPNRVAGRATSCCRRISGAGTTASPA